MFSFFYSAILLCFVSGYALFADEKAPSFSKGPPFEWVKTYDPLLDLEDSGPLGENVHWLLSDRQKNCEEGTTYDHYAFQLLTPQGVAEHSQLEIIFDPAYQKVVIHKIQVIRSGKYLDRMEHSRNNVVQREKGLNCNLYDGRKTIVFFLDDIRQNDIVEYSYSIIGENPNFSSFLDEYVFLEGTRSIEKMCRRILANPERKISSKTFNTDQELTTEDLSPSLREWSWEGTQLQGSPFERDSPSWHVPVPYVQLSQYPNWHAVVKQVLPLYDISKDDSEEIPPEVLKLIQQWKNEGPDPTLRACLALRFVQDEVRYLGFEEGIGAHKPRHPHLIFRRRYGDCKDKSVLLHYLLDLMGISSNPVLVHSNQGKLLADDLPSPYRFNHVVVKIDIGNMSFWVDPTRSFQGGSLMHTFFPRYHWGLVISKDTTALTPIPESEEKPIEIHASYEMLSKEEAKVTIIEKLYGCMADEIRSRIGYRGRKKFEEKALAVLQRIYGSAIEDQPLEIEDLRWINQCTMTKKYRVPVRKSNEMNILDVGSIIIRDYLDSDLNPDSSSPYALSYPLWVQEHVHVENPYISWEKSTNEEHIKHEAFDFKFSEKIQKNSLDFCYELKHLKDHVPVQSLGEYWNKTKEVNCKASREVPISRAEKKPQQPNNSIIRDIFNSLFK